MATADSIQVVNAWQDALNRQDADALLALSDPNIEIIGPRGSAFGREVLRAWLERAGLKLTTLHVFARDEHVVIAQQGVWQSAETGGLPSQANVASHFVVIDRHVTSYARFDDLVVALKAAGLTEADLC